MANNKFNFIGTVMFPKKDSKKPFFKEFVKDKKDMASMNFGIKASDTNMVFVEAFGSAQEIKTMSVDNEKIAIKWADRTDPAVIKTVASYKKHFIDLGEDFGGKCEFISTYDALAHLAEWLPKYKGKVQVTGQLNKDATGKYGDKYDIQNVYAVADDIKSRFNLTIDIFYNKSCIDKSEMKNEKKIFIDGYVSQYINSDEGSKFLPQRFVLNFSKLDLENERHAKIYDYVMGYIDIDKKLMHHIPWEIRLIRGAEAVEFNESMLTKAQKVQIELNIKTLDDFKPKGNIAGDKISEYRLLDPSLVGDFSDGLLDSGYSASEFEELIYVVGESSSNETLETAAKKGSKKADDKKDDTKKPSEDSKAKGEDLFA